MFFCLYMRISTAKMCCLAHHYAQAIEVLIRSFTANYLLCRSTSLCSYPKMTFEGKTGQQQPCHTYTHRAPCMNCQWQRWRSPWYESVNRIWHTSNPEKEKKKERAQTLPSSLCFLDSSSLLLWATTSSGTLSKSLVCRERDSLIDR